MPDELILYDNRGSSNALKVRFLLGELGLSARLVEIPIPIDGERPDWYKEIHPFATVPCLVDGDVVLVESNTMLRYLADREGREDLYPRDPASRARVDQLLDVVSLSLRPALWEVELRTYYTNGSVSQAELDTAVSALQRVLAGWERLIEPDGYVTGAFSIADVAVRARMWLLPKLPIDLSASPRTQRMLDVVGARPAFLAAL
jgi:glutathione S-transferase